MSCSDVEIDDCFLRTSDDCLAFYNHRWGFWGDTRNITVRNTVLWADVAHPVNIGGHGDDMSPEGETISNILCEDIDILECRESQPDYQGCLAISCGDNNTVRDVAFRNIRVEDVQLSRLFNFSVLYNAKYNRVPGRGIHNVLVENVSYQGQSYQLNPSVLKGYSSDRLLSGVVFRNVRLNGQLLTGLDAFETNGFIRDIRFE